MTPPGLPAHPAAPLVDPRAGLCLVWGHVSAGVAANAIPRRGVLKGTLRVLDKDAWRAAPTMVQRVVDGLVLPYGASDQRTRIATLSLPELLDELLAHPVTDA